MKALLIGATGLVGRLALAELLASSNYSQVITISRSAIDLEHPKLLSIIADFSEVITTPEKYADALSVDQLFCTLGTTIKTVGGDKAQFVKIDLEWPVAIAKLSSERGCGAIFAVSALGANSASGNLYSRTKGQLEEQLEAIGFHSCIIYQPSLLIGKRDQLNQPPRRGESIGQALMPLANPLLRGNLRKYRGTPIQAIATQMVKDGVNPPQGFKRHYFTD